MSEARQDGPVWERLDTLDDAELKGLIAAALSVLAESADDATARGTVEMPPGPVARALEAELREEGLEVDEADAERLVYDEATSREVAIAALRELGKQPALAAEIEEAWRARGEMMIVDAGILSAGALLLLVMKLKRVRVKKGDVDVEFYEVKDGMLGSIRRFLQG